MAKHTYLFSLEEENEVDPSKNNLAIDKVVKLDKLEKIDPSNLSTVLLKERNEIKAQLGKIFSEKNTQTEESSNEEESSSEEESSDELDFNAEEDTDKEDKEDKEDSKEEEEKDNKEEDEDKESEESKEDKEDKDKEDKDKKEEEKPTQESLRELFTPLKSYLKESLLSLEKFSLNKKKFSLEEQPIAYVRKDVLEVLRNFIFIIDKYHQYNKNLIEKRSQALLDLDKKINYIESYQKNDQVEFTQELIRESSFFSLLLSTDCKNVRDSLRTLNNFYTEALNFFPMLEKNTIDSIPDIAKSIEFKQDEKAQSLYIYKKILPGFNKVYLTFTPYEGYMKTEVDEYQVSRLKVVKVVDLTNLDPIVINNKNDVLYICSIVEEIDSLVSKIIEMLHKENEETIDLLEKVKAINYDVEHRDDLKLSDIPIEGYLKEFLKKKYLFDMASVSLDIYSEFMSALISLLDKSISLKG